MTWKSVSFTAPASPKRACVVNSSAEVRISEAHAALPVMSSAVRRYIGWRPKRSASRTKSKQPTESVLVLVAKLFVSSAVEKPNLASIRP